jgi:hypothetical protein
MGVGRKGDSGGLGFPPLPSPPFVALSPRCRSLRVHWLVELGFPSHAVASHASEAIFRVIFWYKVQRIRAKSHRIIPQTFAKLKGGSRGGVTSGSGRNRGSCKTGAIRVPRESLASTTRDLAGHTVNYRLNLLAGCGRHHQPHRSPANRKALPPRPLPL